MRSHPHLFEVNARILLERLSEKHGRRLTLDSIPETFWRTLRRHGFDLLWLMGVWRRSPGARQVSISLADLRRDYDAALPGWEERDVVGSPYAIYAYELDPALGEPDELAALRRKLNRLGLSLILDFVPNHLALDHPWTESHPERFMEADAGALIAHPDWFFSPRPALHLAHGRDPYFPPWTDTVQINYFAPEARAALLEELTSISKVADGVRCDMAMLVLNDVFRQTWESTLREAPVPPEEFWTEAVRRIRGAKRGFLFIAEAYWGREVDLIRLGFDFAYDKKLYDLLRGRDARAVRGYVREATDIHPRAAHFIENHDEPRAAAALGRVPACAAAVVIATLPGLRFIHDGQREGRLVRLPVQLGHEPRESEDKEMAELYDRLLWVTNDEVFHDGEWRPVDAGRAWDGNESYRGLLAWTWQLERAWRLVVVNYSGSRAQGRIRLPLPDEMHGQASLRDQLADEVYTRDRDELRDPGLYVDLGRWSSHVLSFDER